MRSALLAALVAFAAAVLPHPSTAREDEKPLKLLFLGDKGHHRPADRFAQLSPALKKRGVQLTYTESLADLNAKTLSAYDGLVVFANHDKGTPEQVKAVLEFVASGKGFVPLHCASFCFIDSQPYVDLVGAQFRSHGTGVFETTLADVDHPILKGYKPFRSWDETYVHRKHNEKGRTVLEYRVEGDVKEPWTWVRDHGKGRVFYTAWGHDARTWGHAGFLNLVERGIRWACGRDPAAAGVAPLDYDDFVPKMTKVARDAPAFEYVEAKVPIYSPGMKKGAQNQMQKPLPSEASMKHHVTPQDFEVRLFADEKLLGGKPLCMNWDERGRLWVAITVDYPNERQQAGKGHDKIVVLEDTDNDGVADKAHTFADKLSVPTSLAFTKGGIVVHQAPHTLWLAEKDGKEASRKILFSGWGTYDTHAGPSNLWYGHDNWLHGIVGYAGFNGTVGDEKHRFSQGFYRFKPDGSKLEFLRSTNNNSWGVGFSEEGLHFGSTANGNPSVYLPIANRYYENVRGWSPPPPGGIAGNERMHPITDKVRQVDYFGHFTAAAGHSLYTARTYPREYWNRTAFVTEPTGHLVATFALKREGANFTSHNAWNLFASQDEWTAPIQAEVGPDGHVWVIDWYNFIVQHNPTPKGFENGKGNAYETPLRDKKHGRIYRVVYKNAPKYVPLDLSKADTKTLIATLKHDNMRWRLHAQRLLVERGEQPRFDLIPLVEDKSVDEIGLNVGAIHALGALEGMDAWRDRSPRPGKAFETGLSHPSAGVRRIAATLGKGSFLLPAKTKALHDEDAQVRLAALLALADSKRDDKAAEQLAALLKDKTVVGDRWLADGLTAAAAANDARFLSKLPAEVGPKGRAIVKLVARHYALGAPKDDLGATLLALAKNEETAVTEAAFSGMAEGWKSGHKVALKDDVEEALAARLPTLSATGKASLLRLLTAVGSKAMAKHAKAIVEGLLATVEKEDAGESARAEAARQVIDLMPDDAGMVKKLLDQITFRTPPAVADGVLDAVGASNLAEVGPELLSRLGGWTPATKSKAIRILLGRRSTASALLDALEKGTVKGGDLALDHKQALASHPDKEVAARAKAVLAKSGDLPNADRQKVVEALLPLTKQAGDGAKGKAVFEAHCAKCHKHASVEKGEDIGPDLTGMSTHPKEELLVHVMDPSRSVEGNFRLYTVTTDKGKSYVGMLASETKTSIEVVDAEAKRSTISRDRVASLEASSKSLMPDGFEKQLKSAEVVDLLEFLTTRVRYWPLALGRAATVVSTRGMFFDEDSTVERMVFADWGPKTFDGVPFVLVDPKGGKEKNVVLLHSKNGKTPPRMPKSVSLPVNSSAKAIHLLGGVAGWASPYGSKGSVSMIVRLHYKDGKVEDHPLRNGEHVADYIKKVEVPGSKHAFALRSQQVRYLAVTPRRDEAIATVELVKGTDDTAPIVMAVTVETR